MSAFEWRHFQGEIIRLWCKYLDELGKATRQVLYGEHGIPDRRCSLVLQPQPTHGELPLVNAAKQFNAGNRSGRALKILEAEHGSGSELDPAMILFDAA